jgi:hypothetical protein
VQSDGASSPPRGRARIKISRTELAVAREKVIRAQKHCQVAERLITRFARHHCRIRTKLNPHTQEIDVIANLPDPPPLIGLLIGDCVHNLRSALDHIVYALVSSNPDRPSGTPSTQTMFPIRDTHAGYRHQIEKLRRLDGLPDAAAALVDRMQPYHTRESGGDHTLHPLWILDKLDNIDKHRRLMLASVVARHVHVNLVYPDGRDEDHLFLSQDIHHNAVLTSFPAALQGQVKVGGYLALRVELRESDELPSLAEQHVIELMMFLIEQVYANILTRFARLTSGGVTRRRKRRQDLRFKMPKT